MPKKIVEEIEEQKPKYEIKKKFYSGTGRRKTAVARVFLYEGKGDIFVNHLNISDYFKSEKESGEWKKPFYAVGISHPASHFNATAKVEGSGKSSQLGAVVLGISCALALVNEDYRKALSKGGFLTRDSRMVERKKYWLRKARKAPQYSKR